MKKRNNLSLVFWNRPTNPGTFLIKHIGHPLCLALLQLSAGAAIHTPNITQTCGLGLRYEWPQAMDSIFKPIKCGVIKIQWDTWLLKLPGDLGNRDGKMVLGVSPALNPKDTKTNEPGGESTDSLPTRFFKKLVDSFILVPIVFGLTIWIGSWWLDRCAYKTMMTCWPPRQYGS